MRSHPKLWRLAGGIVAALALACSSEPNESGKGTGGGGEGHGVGGAIVDGVAGADAAGSDNSAGGSRAGGTGPGLGGSGAGGTGVGGSTGAALGGAGGAVNGTGGEGGYSAAGGAVPGDGGALTTTGGSMGLGGRLGAGGVSGGTSGGSSGGAAAGGGGAAGDAGSEDSTDEGIQYLSELCDEGSSNGWGPVERNLSNGEEEERDGGPIIINGQSYGRGLGMHAPAEIVFDLGGACSAFLADVGIDEEMKGAGSVVFQVWGDDSLLFESASMGGWQGPLPIEVDLAGVQSLRLAVDDDGGNGSDHADWGDARVLCRELRSTDCAPAPSPVPVPSGWHLVWSDEFEGDGRPNPDNWGYERGMVRNNEWQYYTDQNASVVGGFLVIQGRREAYEDADYTSASLRTMNDNWTPKQAFRYGRFEMRARVVAEPGLWPAFWTLGTGLGNWPFNGEIDIMEYYGGRIHANVASSASTDQNAYSAQWDGASWAISDLGVADWDAKFHVWRMDWDGERIVLSVDDTVMNDVPIQSMLNADGSNPFAQPHYILVNLAIGGNAGGDASGTHFPVHYVVDYVRVYQRD